LKITAKLKKERPTDIFMKLEGDVFAIFRDPKLVHSDPFLKQQYENNHHRFTYFCARSWLKSKLPSSILDGIGKLRNKGANAHP
jgi:hypothetical protein